MKVMFAHPRSRNTGKLIAEELNLKCYTAQRSFRKSLLRGKIPVIRYGVSFGNDDTDLNYASKVLNVSNSRIFSELMNNNGILSPNYRRIRSVNDVPESFPVFLRRCYHYGGKDIVIIRDEGEWNRVVGQINLVVDKRFSVRFIPTRYEIRVHVFDGDILRVFVKHGDDKDEFPIRTSYNGYTYHVRDHSNKYSKAKEIAKNVMKVVGLRFGAIDMGWSDEYKNYIVFEVNSAPSLASNHNTLALYLERFYDAINLG